MNTDDALLAPTTAAEFGGHAIITALVTALFGLALATWQARRRRTGLALAVLPAAALWSAIADHAMYNAGLDLFSALPGDDGTPAWLDPHTTTIPWWLRVPWSLLGHGHGRVAFFLALVVVCLLVDAARLATRPAAGLTGRPAPHWVARPVPTAPRAVQAVLGAVTALVWVVARDLAHTLAGFARRPVRAGGEPSGGQPVLPQSALPEPRRAAAARGAALVSGQRALRELAYEHASAHIRPWARRLASVAVLAGLGWLVFAAAPATAREIGTTTNDVFDLGPGPGELPALPSDPPGSLPTDLPSGMPTDLPTTLPSDLPTFDPEDFPSLDPDFEFPSLDTTSGPEIGSSTGPGSGDWLAGILDSLADWWHDQPLLTQLAIGAGIAALVVLSGGSLGLALGISGILTWGLDKSAGIATFVRDPHQATRDYFATATPAQLAADTAGVALTFLPGNFAGAATGRVLRTTADDLIADPAAWLALRRKNFTPRATTDKAASSTAHNGGSALTGATVVSGRFPRSAGAGEILARRGADGKVTNYQVYGSDGLPLKRVDVTGKPHAGVATPHVVEFERHINPTTGETFIRPSATVRPATPEELMGL
ncbi:polymorphic toxin type 24 domain-containing protein [Promicromonospora sp. NPDC019610]|uniref:polymorphic toxin type 24 domain-containing protein n=1 Tax=Promicromonospora sp. NPDC019610 TaxID=3364405 RepID=UPI00378B74D4